MGFKFSNKIKYNQFISNHTPESVYILGLLWADGTINKKTNGFSLECIKEDIDNFYPIFQTTGEYGLYVRKREHRKVQGVISGSSLELSTFLKENDYTIKSIASPNKILLTIPEELKHYFFLGWSDGDGNFYLQRRNDKKRNITQYTMSGSYEQKWDSLIELCEKLKIKYRIDRVVNRLNHKHSSFRICRGNDIVKFGNYIYNNSTKLGLIRKMEYYKCLREYVNSRPKVIIECLDLYDNLINEFDSLNSASLWMNRNRNVASDINEACSGRQKTAFGFKWKKLHIN